MDTQLLYPELLDTIIPVVLATPSWPGLHPRPLRTGSPFWNGWLRLEHYQYDVRSYPIMILLATIIPVVLATSS